MSENIDKQKIYHLIDMYLSNKISEPTFCNEFYCLYDLGLDFDTLTKDEDQAFYELSNITCRFSQYEEDFKSCPDFFYTKAQVRQNVIETEQKLKKYFDEWHKVQNSNWNRQ